MTDTRDDDGSSVVISKEPCPQCGSSDNVKRYADGHAHCFSAGCDFHEGPRGDVGGSSRLVSTERRAVPVSMITPSGPNAFRDLQKRHLAAGTLRRYGYFLGEFGGDSAAHIYTCYDQKGEPVRQKSRLKGKEFSWTKITDDAPKPQDCQFFGQQVWGDKHDKRVVIFTGEIDAMSAAQATDFKTPCVSVLGGDDSAKAQLQANYRWLDRYDEIVLFFDNDESGQKAARQCAELFEVGKVKIAKVEGFKDASELMQAKRPGDIGAAIFAAVTWRPDGVVNAADCAKDLMDEEALKPTYTYKWPFLNEKLVGLFKGQVVYVVAGTGMGKTSLVYDLEIDWLAQGAKIGHCGFEDMRADVQLGLLSAKLGRRLILQPLPKDELMAAHKDLFGGRKVELFDPETAEWSMDAIIKYIRYMAKALECDIIIVDPISFIASGIGLNEDERRVLDHVAQRLGRLAKELSIHLIITHHLKRITGEGGHENGAEIQMSHLRGSGGLANYASTVIGIEGDQQGDEPCLRTIRIVKNRKIGPTGEAGCLHYDPNTGVFTEHKSNKKKAADGY